MCNNVQYTHTVFIVCIRKCLNRKCVSSVSVYSPGTKEDYAGTNTQQFNNVANVMTFNKDQDLCNLNISLFRILDDTKPVLNAANINPQFTFIFTIKTFFLKHFLTTVWALRRINGL